MYLVDLALSENSIENIYSSFFSPLNCRKDENKFPNIPSNNVKKKN